MVNQPYALRARKFGPTAITRDPRGFWDESATAGIRHVSSNMLERVEFAELPLPRSYRISEVARARAKTRLTLTPLPFLLPLPPSTLFTRKYVEIMRAEIGFRRVTFISTNFNGRFNSVKPIPFQSLSLSLSLSSLLSPLCVCVCVCVCSKDD